METRAASDVFQLSAFSPAEKVSLEVERWRILCLAHTREPTYIRQLYFYLSSFRLFSPPSIFRSFRLDLSPRTLPLQSAQAVEFCVRIPIERSSVWLRCLRYFALAAFVDELIYYSPIIDVLFAATVHFLFTWWKDLQLDLFKKKHSIYTLRILKKNSKNDSILVF